MAPDGGKDRQARRLRRQIEAISRAAPRTGMALRSLIHGRLRYVRIPLGLLFIVAGFVGFLPVLGFWMVPLGLLILAVDVPALRPAITAAVIRLRRRLRQALGPHGRLAWLGRRLGRNR